MSVTKEDLQDFGQFADQKVSVGAVNSLSELVREWEASRPKASSNKSKIELPPESLQSLAAAFPDTDDVDRLRQASARRGGATTEQLLAKARAAERAG